MHYLTFVIEDFLRLTGLTGGWLVATRHLLLIIAAILLAWLSDWLCRKTIVPLIEKITAKTDARWDNELLSSNVLISACHIVPAIVIWRLLPLIFFQYPIAQEVMARLTAIYITVMSVRTALAFIGSFDRLELNTTPVDKRDRSAMRQYLKSFCGVLKIILLFVSAIIIIALALGRNPMTLFAGLGATSAILMLVFKDTIEGLAAGIRLTSNDMLHRGDWITVPGTQVNGIVQDISLTTVKVRNFDNTILTVSPTALVNGSFQNWIGMQHGGGRRVQRKLYFDFRSIKPEKKDGAESTTNTTTNLSRFRYDMEQLLRADKRVNTQLTIMVRQLEATQCGLPIEFYFFIRNKEWVSYEHTLADIMEVIYAKTAEYGLTIYQQYPEQ